MNALYCSECLSRLSQDDADSGVCAACSAAAKRSAGGLSRGLDQQSIGTGRVLGAVVAVAVFCLLGCSEPPLSVDQAIRADRAAQGALAAVDAEIAARHARRARLIRDTDDLVRHIQRRIGDLDRHN